MSRKPRWLAGFAAIIIAVAMTLVGGVPANAGKERPDSLGKEFWVAFPSNYSSMTPTLSLFISSPDATNGTVAIPGLPWSEDFCVTTGAVTTVQIPAAAQLSLGDSGAVENRGIKVTAADEVTVYGLNRIQATTDAYLGLPVDVLGTEHLVLGWPDLMGQLRSEFAVLASQDGTDVTYVPNAKTTSGTDVGVAKTVTLNAGEALPRTLSCAIAWKSPRSILVKSRSCSNVLLAKNVMNRLILTWILNMNAAKRLSNTFTANMVESEQR